MEKGIGMSRKSREMSDVVVMSEDWCDKKRYFGAPISFTYYSIADGRLYIKRGFFATHYDEVMLFRIYDIKMVETLWQKLFGVGTVVAYTSDASSTHKVVRLINIKRPLYVRDFLSRRVEAARDEKGIQGAEFIGPFA